MLNPSTRALLESLRRFPRVSVAIISGRSLPDLKKRVRLRGILYAGNHGLEVEGEGVRFVEPSAQAARGIMRRIAVELEAALCSVEGEQVENKGLTLSVHYRNVAPHQRARLEELVERTLEPYVEANKVRMRSGKMVREVIPPTQWGKGAAAEWIVDHAEARWQTKDILPVSIGDDLTDEDAFAAVRKRGGIPIFVGQRRRRSCAPYWLRSPAEVWDFLSRILSLMEERTDHVA